MAVSDLTVGGHGALAMRQLFARFNIDVLEDFTEWMENWIDRCGDLELKGSAYLPVSRIDNSDQGIITMMAGDSSP